MLNFHPFKLIPEALELLAITEGRGFKFLNLERQLIDDTPGDNLFTADPRPSLCVVRFPEE